LQVDVSIIEVGLGGRNDSTNVVFIFPQNHLIIIIIIIIIKIIIIIIIIMEYFKNLEL
jgi:hypothetical protein